MTSLTAPVDRRVPAFRSVSVVVGALLLCLAIWLGTRELTGTFGVTREPVSCGTVWGIATIDDLNARTCTDDLRARLTVVATLIGLAGLVAFVPLALSARGTPTTTRGRVLVALAVSLPILVAIVMIVGGRQRIWSVSGS